VPVTVSKVGHVVLRVREIDRSVAFYEQLGLREVARRHYDDELWVFLSAGSTHHDLAMVESADLGTTAGALHHLGLHVGGTAAELAEAKSSLERGGIAVHAALDFTVSQALFVSDPDGNLVELFVDAADEPWLGDPSLVAAEPLELTL
jgi:catechol 2,3-dioxygenase